ncbi:carbohydrate ABC transporter permease [Paenibacillus glycinis]|uniref:ABC transporter permease subunit n=1 Tax=Paenibacillus glycinis TaxID=2697035 RepID=A0ABW9XT22_9BACL|nr:carbohydrate ABC transporter permease [Paenibacillus glycinis]NBD25765.1 ABC transporter permease subunit [Paenibacillus glycinis]
MARANPAMNRKSPLGWPFGIVMAAFAAIQLFPLLWLVDYSLLKSSQFFGASILIWPKPAQWANYRIAFTAGHIPRYLTNSLVVAAVTIFLTVLLSMMTAYVLTRMKWRLSSFFYTLLVVGLIIPLHATLLPNFFIFKQFHLLDSYGALILPYVAFGLPFCTLIFCGFLQTVPRALEEAAVLDGLSVPGILVRIMLPITRPAIATVSVFSFLSSWNEFIMALTYVRSELYKTLPFSLLQFTGQYSSNYAAQAAVMTVIAIPSVVVYLLFTDQITSSISHGSVKG